MPKTRHERQSEQTRRRPLDATRDLVVANGWSSISSRAIAERAGVNQALIKFHFKGKAGLFRATLDRCVDEIEKEFGPWMEAPSFAAYIDKCIESSPRVRRNKNFKFLFAAMLEGAHDEKIKKAVTDRMHAFREGLSAFLAGQGMAPIDPAPRTTVLVMGSEPRRGAPDLVEECPPTSCSTACRLAAPGAADRKSGCRFASARRRRAGSRPAHCC